MAKRREHERKREKRRERARRAASGEAPRGATTAPMAPAQPKTGYEATRGSVSPAYRAWAADYARRQADAVAAQGEGGAESGQDAASEGFMLAPLTTRTVAAPDGGTISVQIGLPILTGGSHAAPAPARDRLAAVVLRLPEADTGGALAALGLGQAPEMPPPEPLFVLQLPAEGMRAVRPADALAWHLARGIEAGDVAANPQAIAAAAGEALALLRPAVAPRGARRLNPSELDSYEGYGADADAEAVPPDIAAAPARGGLPGLPAGAFLQDDGTPLAPLLADLRDYVVGLWPFEYFGLDSLAETAEEADGPARTATLATLAEIVRRLDEVIAQNAEEAEAALAAEGRPPAWIAEELAPYRETRQTLRETRTAQEMLERLGPILFDLDLAPPADYKPRGTNEESEGNEEIDDETEEEE